MMPRWAVGLILLLLAAPTLYFGWTYRTFPHLGMHHDDELYVVSAQSLAEGNGYSILSLPGQPAQTKYPVLFPALIAAVSGGQLDRLPAVMGLCLLLVLVYLAVGFGKLQSFGLTPIKACLALLLTVSSPMFVIFGTSIMSDVLFSGLLLAAVWLAERAGREAGSGGIKFAIGAGLLAGAGFLIRSAALPLALTVPAILWWRGRRREAFAFLASMLPAVISWQVWSGSVKATGVDTVTQYYCDYLKFHLSHIALSDVPMQLWINIDQFLMSLGKLIAFVPEPGFFGIQLLRFLGLMAVVGTIRMVWNQRDKGQFQWAAACFSISGLLMIWHFPPNERFVLPVFLLFAAGFVCEAEHFAGMVKQTLATRPLGDRIVAGGLVAVVVAGIAMMTWNKWQGHTEFLPAVYGRHQMIQQDREVAYRWIQANTARSAKIWSYDDPLLYMRTKRQGNSSPMLPEMIYRDGTAELQKFIDGFPDFVVERGLSYVLVTRQDFFRDLQEENRIKIIARIKQDSRFERLHDSPEFVVFGLKNPVAAAK